MKYFNNKNRLFFYFFTLFFSETYFTQTAQCPEIIKNNFYIIQTLPPDNYFRFSKCFICSSYNKNKATSTSKSIDLQGFVCLFSNKIYIFNDTDNCIKNYFNLPELENIYLNLLIKTLEKKIEYYIYFFGNNKHINFFRYIFNITEKKNYPISINEFDIKIENPTNFNCQIYDLKGDLICFYIIESNIFAKIFYINKNSNTSIKLSGMIKLYSC